jgi:hypothetical protein
MAYTVSAGWPPRVAEAAGSTAIEAEGKFVQIASGCAVEKAASTHRILES